MPTPEEQRVYHAKLKEKKGETVIDDGDVLMETVAPWQTWIGKPGEVSHSTKFHPPARVRVPRGMAERLMTGNAAVIVEEPKPKRKPGRPRKTKAMEPDENK